MSYDSNVLNSSSSLKLDGIPKDSEDSHLVNSFKYVAAQTGEKYFTYIKLSTLQELYPEIHKTNPFDLKMLHDQLVSQLKSCFTETVEEVCSGSNTFQSLSSLDNILTNSDGSTKAAWRPSGNPQEDIRDHLHQLKLNQKMNLEFTLQRLAIENDSFEQTMRDNHEEVIGIKGKIDDCKQDLYEHFSALNDPTIIDLVEKLATVEQKTT